jgi:hypothetical protein
VPDDLLEEHPLVCSACRGGLTIGLTNEMVHGERLRILHVHMAVTAIPCGLTEIRGERVNVFVIQPGLVVEEREFVVSTSDPSQSNIHMQPTVHART